MKITYKFADGTISEVEVSEELGQAITTSRREEENYERKMRYHCPISIDQLEYQGIEFADPDTPFSLYERKLKEQEQKAINDFVMSHLTETQRRRILKLAEGMSVCEIADEEGVAHQVISKSIEGIRKKAKKLKKLFEMGCETDDFSPYSERHNKHSLSDRR